MTADMPDPLKVAREALAKKYDETGWHDQAARIRDVRQLDTDPLKFAILGARAMQDAMAGRVRVKALEWVEEVQDLWWSADTYRIEAFDGGGFATRVATPQSQGFRTIAHGVTFEKAQAVAQADYERRISSALEPAGAQEGAKTGQSQKVAMIGHLDHGKTSLATAVALVLAGRTAPTPDVPGLVATLRRGTGIRESVLYTEADAHAADCTMKEAAEALEALQAEVATLQWERNVTDDDIRRHRGWLETARARATAAEAERDALRAEAERKDKALAPFAAYADAWSDDEADETLADYHDDEQNITLADCRRARAALSPAKAGG